LFFNGKPMTSTADIFNESEFQRGRDNQVDKPSVEGPDYLSAPAYFDLSQVGSVTSTPPSVRARNTNLVTNIVENACPSTGANPPCFGSETAVAVTYPWPDISRSEERRVGEEW